MIKRYKHVATGAIIDSPSKIIGKSWKLIEEVEQDITEVAPEETEEYVEEEIDLEEMTKAELVAFAKEHKVEVNERDTKDKIIETIAKAFE